MNTSLPVRINLGHGTQVTLNDRFTQLQHQQQQVQQQQRQTTSGVPTGRLSNGGGVGGTTGFQRSPLKGVTDGRIQRRIGQQPLVGAAAAAAAIGGPGAASVRGRGRGPIANRLGNRPGNPRPQQQQQQQQLKTYNTGSAANGSRGLQINRGVGGGSRGGVSIDDLDNELEAYMVNSGR